MDTHASRIEIPPPPGRRGGRRPGAGRPRGSKNQAARDIRDYLRARTGEGSIFRSHIDYLIESRRIFLPENRWLCTLVMQYAYGMPPRMAEQEQEPRQQLVFLSMNPIGRPEFDPLANALPVGRGSTVDPAPPARDEPEPAGPFRGLDGQERDPADEPQPFNMQEEALRSRRADYH